MLAISLLAFVGSDAGALTSGDVDRWGLAGAPIPSDLELLSQLAEAVELRQRREHVRVLDAKEPGELAEDARLTQEAIDRGIFGLDALFAAGDDLFELAFRPEQGLGNGLGGAAPSVAATTVKRRFNPGAHAAQPA